ncbi:hypothetical protein HYPSUDRAFT_57196 [Hypholoma sublateritium FD-334 SS-4]|uniref:Uncharacterized protein n=1 Tax=Hypholoma sublateritium (strain FD-334 SS-4) TaxID=945553 RepID=A0A0D2M591_HYPSF|nr:hypothetical protein HYPSUDRAFT_57196 [Hypholoma sublateritium FD-334 SS-4]
MLAVVSKDYDTTYNVSSLSVKETDESLALLALLSALRWSYKALKNTSPPHRPLIAHSLPTRPAFALTTGGWRQKSSSTQHGAGTRLLGNYGRLRPKSSMKTIKFDAIPAAARLSDRRAPRGVTRPRRVPPGLDTKYGPTMHLKRWFCISAMYVYGARGGIGPGSQDRRRKLSSNETQELMQRRVVKSRKNEQIASVYCGCRQRPPVCMNAKNAAHPSTTDEPYLISHCTQYYYLGGTTTTASPGSKSEHAGTPSSLSTSPFATNAQRPDGPSYRLAKTPEVIRKPIKVAEERGKVKENEALYGVSLTSIKPKRKEKKRRTVGGTA